MTRDLQHAEDIKSSVKEAYRSIERTSPAVAVKLYSEEQLALVPRQARDRALGVGNHLAHADIRPGDVVLDIGCGGGIDTVLAAHRAGPAGRVVALDFLPEMLERTAAAAAAAGLDNVQTLEGEMESIPLPAGSVDVVISNGVINLSPRKQRVFHECARVLRPDGRFCASDLTTDPEELPAEILTHPAAWAG